jgi:hypothetical protein
LLPNFSWYTFETKMILELATLHETIYFIVRRAMAFLLNDI